MKATRPYHRHAARDVLTGLESIGTPKERLQRAYDEHQRWHFRLGAYTPKGVTARGYAAWTELHAAMFVWVHAFLGGRDNNADAMMYEVEGQHGVQQVPLEDVIADLTRSAAEAAGLHPCKAEARWFAKVRLGVEDSMSRCPSEEVADLILNGLRASTGEDAEEYRQIAAECYAAWKAKMQTDEGEGKGAQNVLLG